MGIFGDRGDPLQSKSSPSQPPSLSFPTALKILAVLEPITPQRASQQGRVAFLRIGGGLFQSWTEITMIVIVVKDGRSIKV